MYHLAGVFKTLTQKSCADIVLKVVDNHICLESEIEFKLIKNSDAVEIHSKPGTNVSFGSNGSIFCSAGNVSVKIVNGKTWINGVLQERIVDGRELKKEEPDLEYSTHWTMDLNSFHRVISSGSGDLDMDEEIGLDLSCTIQLQSSGDIFFDNRCFDRFVLGSNGSGDFASENIIAVTCTINCSGSGNVTIETINIANLTMTINGSGDVAFHQFTSSNARINSNGSGNFTCDGTIENLDFGSHGSGDGKLHCNVDIAHLSSHGSGNISGFTIVKSLNAHSFGSGDIYGKAHPNCKVTKSKHGSGSIKIKQ